MDAFKPAELARMAAGGNEPFRAFFNAHGSNAAAGRSFAASTIAERYDSAAGDEWKERLSCKVEGRDFDAEKLPKRGKRDGAGGAAAVVPTSGRASAAGSRSQTPLSRTRSSDVASGGGIPARSASPSLGTASLAPSKKTQNESFFARMGAENAQRPAELPPSQGGKYAGFGSEPAGWKKDGGEGEEGAPPALDEFQKDPVAALTKGFGWLGATVGKGAKTGYEGWVKPGVQKVCFFFFVVFSLGFCWLGEVWAWWVRGWDKHENRGWARTAFSTSALRRCLRTGILQLLIHVYTARRSRPRSPSPPNSRHAWPGHPAGHLRRRDLAVPLRRGLRG